MYKRQEGEVARGNLVAEGLAYLTNAERNLLTCGALDILEVYEDALCGLCLLYTSRCV